MAVTTRSHGRETQVSSLPRFGYSSRNPSFSSSLLDAVYRSIDMGDDQVVFYGESVKTQERYLSGGVGGGGGRFRGLEKEQGNLQRASMIEKWIEEKKIQGKIGERKKSGVYYGGGAVSEVVDMFPRPKPVRTAAAEKSKSKNRGGGDEIEAGAKKRGEGSSNTKSRAMKIYSELKKVKQPISPGGKLVEILNSLFAGNQKKHKSGADNYTNSGNTSTCSFASAFSRSITTTKTPSSDAAGKKSIRFSSETEYFFQNPTQTTMRSMFESTKDTRNSNESGKSHVRENENEVLEDDGASCASSDLFELENLSAIGVIDKYKKNGDEGDELPVYETTNLLKNRTIARGFIL